MSNMKVRADRMQVLMFTAVTEPSNLIQSTANILEYSRFLTKKASKLNVKY